MPHETLTPPPPAAPDAAVCTALGTVFGAVPSPLVLAVSGGADSMALLHAAARFAPERVAAVATFDHRTGPAAGEAADLVVRTATALGFAAVRGAAPVVARTEAAWRAMRWTFLNAVAERYGARVATAHTADDQLETMVQRELRGTGARGLAALGAASPIVRPWLQLSRATVRAYVGHHGIAFVSDPANRDRRYQRVRVRLDMLPALEAAHPGFGAAMLALGERAARWRREVDELVRALPWEEITPGVWRLERKAIAGWSPASLGVLWPALFADVSAPLSGEGTERLVRFTIGNQRAGELQLPDDVTVVRRARWLEVRAGAISREQQRARDAAPQVVTVGNPLSWPGWSIGPVAQPLGESHEELDASWGALPSSAEVVVRRWCPGDRIRTARYRAGRRISRYLSEAGVPRRDRRGWPVVLFEGQVVWVPGIVRGLAAPHRSGRSDLIWYRSDRECR